MRCSECSAPVTPVVAVDVDGTLGHYHSHFTDFASAYLDTPLPKWYNGSVPFHEWLELDKRTYRDVKLAYRLGGGKRTMPVFAGAPRFMAELATLGAEVWITTTRPYLRLDNTDPDTRFWLERHGMPYHHMLYDEDKYEQLATYVDAERVLMVIDDLGEQCDRAVALGMEVWQPHRVHNQQDRSEVAVEFAAWPTPLARLKEKIDAFA